MDSNKTTDNKEKEVVVNATTEKKAAKKFEIDADKTPIVEANEKVEARINDDQMNSGREVLFSFDGILNTGATTVGGNMKIDLASMDTSSFKEYPVMLFSHDDGLPIGQFKNVRMTNRGLEARGEILSGGGSPSQQAVNLVRSGLMSGISVGVTFSYNDLVSDKGKNGEKIYTIMNSTLLEASVVAIPADYSARITQSENTGRSLIVQGKNFAEFGKSVDLNPTKDNKYSLRFCTPIVTKLNGKTTEERELQEDKEAGVKKLDAQPKTLSIDYSDGLTPDQEKKKALFMEGGIPEKEAEKIAKEKTPNGDGNVQADAQTTPPPAEVLNLGATPTPAPMKPDIGDMRSGSDIVKFLGRNIDVGEPMDTIMNDYSEAIEEATNKGNFNGRAYSDYGDAIRYEPSVSEELNAFLLALKRRNQRVAEKKLKNDKATLRASGIELKVRYKDKH